MRRRCVINDHVNQEQEITTKTQVKNFTGKKDHFSFFPLNINHVILKRILTSSFSCLQVTFTCCMSFEDIYRQSQKIGCNMQINQQLVSVKLSYVACLSKIVSNRGVTFQKRIFTIRFNLELCSEIETYVYKTNIIKICQSRETSTYNRNDSHPCVGFIWIEII